MCPVLGALRKCRLTRISDTRVVLVMRLCRESSVARLGTPTVYVTAYSRYFSFLSTLPNRCSALLRLATSVHISEQSLSEAIVCPTPLSRPQSSTQHSETSTWKAPFKPRRSSLADLFRSPSAPQPPRPRTSTRHVSVVKDVCQGLCTGRGRGDRFPCLPTVSLLGFPDTHRRRCATNCLCQSDTPRTFSIRRIWS